MVITAQDMYTYVLEGIFKQNTSTLYPQEFNDLINKCQLEYVQNKIKEEEENQKRTDDLRELRTITTNILPTGVNTFPLPYNSSTNPPGYLYLIAANFMINYVNNCCGLTGTSGYMAAKTLKGDWNQYELQKDPYNRPSDSKLYYKVVGDNVILITGTASTGAYMEVDYYKYPSDIDVVASPNVNSILAVHCRQEICDIAIKKYLSVVQDPQYQTKSVEIKTENI
jgi:hypothetical protein